MTQFELAQFAKAISKLSFTPWHKRYPKLIGPEEFPNGIRFWEYVVNDWIFSQQDHGALLTLLVLCGFDLKLFFQTIVAPPPSPKSTPTAA